MNPTTYTITRKIGSNRGKPRLWIEGRALLDTGLLKGHRWNLETTATGLVITLSADGKRKVSGKADRPVIDITAASLGTLKTGDVVSILVDRKGSLTVTPMIPVSTSLAA